MRVDRGSHLMDHFLKISTIKFHLDLDPDCPLVMSFIFYDFPLLCEKVHYHPEK